MSHFDYAKVASSINRQLSPPVELSIRHNLAILRAVHWGAHEACESELQFDPRADWWHRPERRFAVAFLAYTWKVWPADQSKHPAIESFCVALCSALDGLRESGELTFLTYDYDRAGGIAKVLAPLRALASRLNDHGWSSCRPRKFAAYTVEEALHEFLDWIEEDDFAAHEGGLQAAMRWWGALGARSVDELRARQRFFWLYRLMLCTTNAYVNAGAQYFGPVIGNTKVSIFRDAVTQWRAGIPLEEAALIAHDRDSVDPTSFTDNNMTRELWGFLNLHRGPFYNTRAAEYLREGDDPLRATRRIGQEIHAWLKANPVRERQLDLAFQYWLPRARKAGQQPLAKARRYQRRLDENGEDHPVGAPFDMALNEELAHRGTQLLLSSYSPTERAAVMMHLGLDAAIYDGSAYTIAPSSGHFQADIFQTDIYEASAKAALAKTAFVAGEQATLADPVERLRAATNVWIYAPGGQASAFAADVEHKVARIYWSQLGDLREYTSKDELKARLSELRGPGAPSPVNDANTIWAFARLTNPGDMIIARRGLRTIVGVGEITRPYSHALGDDGVDLHRLGVDWFWTGELSLTSGKGMSARTFVRGDQRKVLLGKLEQQLGSPDADTGAEDEPSSSETAPPYTITEALQDLFFERQDIDKWRRLLERRRNLVLSGPPGVGKTFVARRLARLVTGLDSEDAITIVQFHQAYTYEQFVLGYRPTEGDTAGAGTPPFELAKGPLFRLAEQALRDPDAKFVLIIDEINRGNISRILGEALMLLEADKRAECWGLRLAYALGDSEFSEGRFYLPPNLYVIGTMNTADRSLAVVDYALRRRFAFVDIEPRLHTPQFEAHARRGGMYPSVLARLRDIVATLNDHIRDDRALGRGFCIGHSFFTAGEDPPPWVPDDELPTAEAEGRAHAWLDDVFEYEIEPLLQEYWAEDPEQLATMTALLWKERPQT